MKRRTVIQLAFVSIVFAVLLGVYGIWYAVVSKASAEAAALASEIQTKSQDTARVRAAKEALESLSADEASVRQYLIRTEEIVPFLEKLEETGRALGAQVEVASVAAEPGEGRGRLNLALRITGNFDAVVRTLGAIEYGPYDSRLENLTLDTRPTVDGPSTSWSAAAVFSIGTQAPANQPGS